MAVASSILIIMKKEKKITLWSINFIPTYVSSKTEGTYPDARLNTNIQSSPVHNTQKSGNNLIAHELING